MKLIAIYTVFNGCELLEKSIAQIEPFVDEVILCAQSVSNHGNEISKEDAAIINKSDKIILIYQPDLSLNPKENERRKLKTAIDYAKKRGFTHYIALACDHFYRPEEISEAIDIYNSNPVDVTATYMYTYYKYPTWRLTPIESYLCPFICRIHENTKMTINKYPFQTDPSVRITPADTFMVYNTDEIILHHFSMLRRDIKSKFENAAAKQNFRDKIDEHLREFENYDINENPGVGYFGGRKIELVNDGFGISNLVQSWENADNTRI